MTDKDAQPKKKLAKKLSERYLRNSGEYYLNRFPASSKHFEIVMTRKIDRSIRDHPDQDKTEWVTHVRETLVPYFENLGFLNDEMLAQGLFNSFKNKGFSKAKIKSRMIQKSIPTHLVDDLFSNGFNDKDAIIQFAKKKKIGRYSVNGYIDYNDKQKDLGKLARAGFSYDVAMSVFE